jgi:cyclic beta-1,2-glucan synthetase
MEAMNKAGYSEEELAVVEKVRSEASQAGSNPQLWWMAAPHLQSELASIAARHASSQGSDAFWWIEETRNNLQDLQGMASSLIPWILPEFARLRSSLPKLFEPYFLARVSLSSLPEIYAEILQSEVPELDQLKIEVFRGARKLENLKCRLTALATDAGSLVDDMDFGLFYDQGRKAISIGFDVEESKLQKSCYDLLASEARSVLFLAIAKNDVPQEAWLKLGRIHTRYAGRDVLVSWTGTMFEYLMPALWLKHFPNTLLENSLQGVVDCQRAYVRPKSIPWGISEGACPAKREGVIYDYQAFGLPPLALSPDASRRIIITPYATALALNVQPRKALDNLKAMSDLGWLGSFGFYESVEFHGAMTEARESFEIVHSWMAHHQGMTLVSICNLLMNSIFPSLLHKEVRVEAAERLLHERPLAPYARALLRDTPQSRPTI